MANVINTRVASLHKVPVFKASKPDELTPLKVLELIELHRGFMTRYNLLMEYFKGIHAISSRVMEDSKPNNRPVDNFAEYITKVKTGYFMGTPVTYDMKDQKLMEMLKDVLDYNDEQDNNSELAKLSSIFGHAFELHWVDKDGELRFKYVPPTEMFMIYDRDVEQTPLGAVRYYTVDLDEGKMTFAEVYTATETIYYEGINDKLNETKRVLHPFKDIPVVEFKNNDERIGDFENVVTLIDAYEVVMADAINEVQYFNDAYLVVKNLLATDKEDIVDMKNNRIISLDENGTAEWLVKNINDGHVQNVLDRIQADIHRFSNTPNLTDESFSGNLSGVAIKFKLWGLEQDAVNKERKFKKGLQRRFELIANALNRKMPNAFDWREVKVKFKRNIPTNVLEQSQIVANVNGVVSKKTLLSILPFVENINEELEAVEKEEQEQIEKFGFTAEPKVNNTGTPNDGVTEKQKDENGVGV